MKKLGWFGAIIVVTAITVSINTSKPDLDTVTYSNLSSRAEGQGAAAVDEGTYYSLTDPPEKADPIVVAIGPEAHTFYFVEPGVYDTIFDTKIKLKAGKIKKDLGFEEALSKIRDSLRLDGGE